jgi:DNA-binding MarR family transcriptional regulator
LSPENENPVKQSLTKADYEQLAGFRYTLRIFLRGSEVRARKAGITIQQYLALLAIKGYPEREQINVKELAERLQIKHHSAVGLVDRMVKSGLVARRPGSEDRRTVHISLTPAGEALLQRLATDNVAQLRDVEPHIRALFRDTSSR